MSSLQPVPSPPPSAVSVLAQLCLSSAAVRDAGGEEEAVLLALHLSPAGHGENNCWMQNHHHAGHQALEEEREVAAMKNHWSQALE